MAKSEAAVKDPATKGKTQADHCDRGGPAAGDRLVRGGDLVLHAQRPEQACRAAETAPVGKQPAIFEPMAPAFVANYNQNGRQRYMQVSITMQGRNQADLEALKVHMPVIRNNLVMLFSGQDFATLATPVGQEMLRQKATASVQEVAQKELGKVVIEQLLFTNFVLQ